MTDFNRLTILAKLGIGNELFIRLFLPYIKQIFDADLCSFIFLGSKLEVTNLFTEDVDSLDYVSSQYLGKDFSTISPIFKTITSTGQNNVYFLSDLVTGDTEDISERILKELNHQLLATIFNDGIPLGILAIRRVKNRNEFNLKNKKQLLKILNVIRAGITQINNFDNAYFINNSQNGNCLFDKDCRLLYSNDQGIKLLMLSQFDKLLNLLNSSSAYSKDRSILTTALKQKLVKFFSLYGDTQHGQPVIIWKSSNRWGKFVMNASLININNNKYIDLTIQDLLPFTIKVYTRSLEFDLTIKQTLICLRLVFGDSYNDISSKMCISKHTVIDHVRKLYEKLNVSCRSELITLLVTEKFDAPHQSRSEVRTCGEIF